MATRFPGGLMAKSTSNSTEGSQSPAALNAPRYGTVVPKRIFVGGISASTTEPELHELFSRYGVVTNAKIIFDRAGVSKGYGFVTFDTEEDAQRAQASAGNLTLRDRRLNVAPAVKKQPFARVYDPTQSAPSGTILYHNGVPYTYHNGMAFFIPPESMYQGAGQAAGATASASMASAYPLMYQPPVYYPQHAFQYQNVVASQWTAGGSPWRWNTSSPSGQAAAPPYAYPPPVASGSAPYLGVANGGTESPEYYDPAIVEASAEGGQRQPPARNARPRPGSARREGTPRCSPPSYANGGTPSSSSSNMRCKGPSVQFPQGSGGTRRHLKPPGVPLRPPHHRGVMVPKLVNGVPVMACPTPVNLAQPPPSGPVTSAGGNACLTSPQVLPPRPNTLSAPKGNTNPPGSPWIPPGSPMEAIGDSLQGLGL